MKISSSIYTHTVPLQATLMQFPLKNVYNFVSPCVVNSPIKLMFYLWNNTARSLAICGHVKKGPITQTQEETE